MRRGETSCFACVSSIQIEVEVEVEEIGAHQAAKRLPFGRLPTLRERDDHAMRLEVLGERVSQHRGWPSIPTPISPLEAPAAFRMANVDNCIPSCMVELRKRIAALDHVEEVPFRRTIAISQ